jgi:ribonuclease P protein component
VVTFLASSKDFERVLRTRICARTSHFAAHYMPVSLKPIVQFAFRSFDLNELPTTSCQNFLGSVDNSNLDFSHLSLKKIRLGVVVPKRHARNAVTRSMIKRQIRSIVAHEANVLAEGCWVIRLRSPFVRTKFISAISDQLKLVVREELELLMRQTVHIPVAIS